MRGATAASASFRLAGVLTPSATLRQMPRANGTSAYLPDRTIASRAQRPGNSPESADGGGEQARAVDGRLSGYVSGNTAQVFYVGQDQHVQTLRWVPEGTSKPDVTSAAG